VLDAQVLSDTGWNDYYGALASALEGTPVGSLPLWFTDGIAREMDARRQAQGSFGYTFYVLRPRKP
jgi:hypothetical protein